MNTKSEQKLHWNNIFLNKDTTKVSWFQEKPLLSLELIENYAASKSIKIIDVGGGDSRLPDGLLEQGFEHISILDISDHALERSKKRLGQSANKIKWIAGNILDFGAMGQYDLWHDRAVFHFMTDKLGQLVYKEKLLSCLSPNGIVILGAFSQNDGPQKCSGLSIQQYNTVSISDIFKPEFEILHEFESMHETPSGSKQNFYWVIMQKT